MAHALMYHGGFDRNHPLLKPGASTFQGSDGSERVLPPWPAEARGARIGYMERSGKKFVAVRVLDDQADVVLAHPVLIDETRHLGYGKRFGAEPTIIQDETARVLLEDLIERNPEQRAELIAIRHRALHPTR
ncbi:hypothetical protein J421_2268 [Gemmatirosa kalamazoonensis]|uniref:Uncharacterized protein n=1 Tax=Gemmatirosa kalamazoonensis TaxID=861299 RepID=W0RHK5_9BACT|nr:hypothetical protein [Gemmatirosa kalamazoonensis]AHG89805.1 hypothetical protein J421_2268 [Gemmatirosa kalamazoonensis]